MQNTIDVEIVLNQNCFQPNDEIIEKVKNYLDKSPVKTNQIIYEIDNHLQSTINCIIIGNFVNDYVDFKNNQINANYYVYKLNLHGTTVQCEDIEEEQINLASHLMLPAQETHKLWENLIYEKGVKENLLKCAETMVKFGERKVDTNVINFNRVILLHGPPGTGKTSLCKALSHKLAIRYTHGGALLIEINSHSLFSKWFSESAKLVTQMFGKIQEILENRKLLVCILIDEIESLAHARNQCVNGNEPSDAIRVVNAVLTQIDQIKRYPNVLIFATSNMSESIDLAFIDRADIREFLGLPTVDAICEIYLSCLRELIKVKIILDDTDLQAVDEASSNGKCSGDSPKRFVKSVIKISEASRGLSGRSLRKIPFIAHALFVEQAPATLASFLLAMEKAVAKEKFDRELIK